MLVMFRFSFTNVCNSYTIIWSSSQWTEMNTALFYSDWIYYFTWVTISDRVVYIVSWSLKSVFPNDTAPLNCCSLIYLFFFCHQVCASLGLLAQLELSLSLPGCATLEQKIQTTQTSLNWLLPCPILMVSAPAHQFYHNEMQIWLHAD